MNFQSIENVSLPHLHATASAVCDDRAAEVNLCVVYTGQRPTSFKAGWLHKKTRLKGVCETTVDSMKFAIDAVARKQYGQDFEVEPPKVVFCSFGARATRNVRSYYIAALWGEKTLVVIPSNYVDDVPLYSRRCQIEH